MGTVTGRFERSLLKLKVMRQMFRTVRDVTGSRLKAFQTLKNIKKRYKRTLGQQFINKSAKVDGRYYWRLSAPGFPSKAAEVMHRNEIERILFPYERKGLRSIVFAVTSRCDLNCEHCFEWGNITKEEKLSVEEISGIIKKFQEYGTTQFMLTGGEPMLRHDDICTVIRNAADTSDFWIITSGVGLDKEKAAELKKAGLTGVLVSIEHYIGEEHDRFRGAKNVFNAAVNAVGAANGAGLVTGLSVCVHKGIATREHMTAYMDFAKKLGVTFVQFLDPRKAGRYEGEEIELSPDQIVILENIYVKYNSENEFRDHPIVNYLGYHQRRTGCFGGGDRFFYIDTDGDAHLCPYCRGKEGSTLEHSAEEVISFMKECKCHAFENADVF